MSCNGNCNQGRGPCECTLNKPTGSIINLVLMFIVSVGLMIFAIHIQSKQVTVVYDCRIAEISPDVPVSVKEQCRKKMEK